MSNQNTSLQRTAAFYHSLGKVQTEINNLVGNELYKSAHNVRSNEVWMDKIPYSANSASASQYSDNIIVRQVGTGSNPIYIYPLAQSNYQSWFIDTGTPSVSVDGFIPSSEWVKPLINPSDVTNSAGAPSDGFQLQMFRRDGTTAVAYGSAYYDVDYYAGLIRFDLNKTPIDTSGNSGLGFQFSQSAFEATSLTPTARKSYIQSTSTGGPRVIAWQYVGQFLSNSSIGVTGPQGITGPQGFQGVVGNGFNTVLNPGDNRILTSTGNTQSANAESNLTYDGNTFNILGITGSTGSAINITGLNGPIFQVDYSGTLYINSGSQSGVTSDSIIISLNKDSGSACYFDYIVSNSDNGGHRSGTIMSVWNDSDVEFTDISTPDLSNTTDDLSFDVTLSGSNILLSAIITSGTWKIKIGSRLI